MKRKSTTFDAARRAVNRIAKTSTAALDLCLIAELCAVRLSEMNDSEAILRARRLTDTCLQRERLTASYLAARKPEIPR